MHEYLPLSKVHRGFPLQQDFIPGRVDRHGETLHVWQLLGLPLPIIVIALLFRGCNYTPNGEV